ncbi:tRNA uridine-5-carboxymethylaminomethyl(34) synthesis GTPase MnmE [Rickettsiella endosymbiont of Rhagonycha lignosa]|uniref:tRNA uridine-5-carboxymethylaminomethyl(34) synthesis GTPase MnmE n=1 Tax=Rickettsiella endosymbiont of Rhagonycha lignosa TaxID=3077937 RepID=UPI00313D9E10
MNNFEATLNSDNETIVALATPHGRGGVAVIRVSGSNIQHIAIQLLGRVPKKRYAEYLSFLSEDGSVIDQGLALHFPAPHSFTGEDVLELQGHGGPVIVNCLLKRVIELGARLARPGEFTERAFLNAKLDLVQAEAISDLIEAESEQAARAAMRSLQGDFSQRINQMRDILIDLRTWLEAAIDFSDENIDFLKNNEVVNKLHSILNNIREIKKLAEQGTLLQEGLSLAIVGPPNAGKSSLLNKLSAQESSIVTSFPGTTRDVIREKIQIEGLILNVVDTAGLRITSDEIEKEGIKRTLAEIVKADLILWVVDHETTSIGDLKFWKEQQIFFNDFFMDKRIVIIRNKIDLKQEKANINKEMGFDVIKLSAKTGEGLTLLFNYLKKCAGYMISTEGNFSARRRHLEALTNTEIALNNGLVKLKEKQFPELLAEDLLIGQNFLGEITGQFTTNDLLGKIFSSFCIGK